MRQMFLQYALEGVFTLCVDFLHYAFIFTFCVNLFYIMR
jgi:hypothetical protein